MSILNEYIEDLEKAGEKVLKGELVFKLYDTYGFPIELTEEILSEKGFTIDMDGFHNEMKLQKERARNARGESNYMGSDDNVTNNIPADFNTNFVGYEFTKYDSKIAYIIKDNELVESLEKGDKGIILTEATPFYAEMGGQIGDTGLIYNDDFKAIVEDCKKSVGGKTLHFVTVVEGTLKIGDALTLEVDKVRRNNIRRITQELIYFKLH